MISFIFYMWNLNFSGCHSDTRASAELFNNTLLFLWSRGVDLDCWLQNWSDIQNKWQRVQCTVKASLPRVSLINLAQKSTPWKPYYTTWGNMLFRKTYINIYNVYIGIDPYGHSWEEYRNFYIVINWIFTIPSGRGTQCLRAYTAGN